MQEKDKKRLQENTIFVMRMYYKVYVHINISVWQN